ncbi:MAG: tail fiber protein [bacterium]|nr:tail fiber protein [bacterium]
MNKYLIISFCVFLNFISFTSIYSQIGKDYTSFEEDLLHFYSTSDQKQSPGWKPSKYNTINKEEPQPLDLDTFSNDEIPVIKSLTRTKLQNGFVLDDYFNLIADYTNEIFAGMLCFSTNSLSNAPGWLACDGGEHFNDDYPKLFERLGYTFGGNGVNTFRVPDYSGYFLRGFNNMGGPAGSLDVDPDSRNLASAQLDALQGHQHDIDTNAAHNHPIGGDKSHKHPGDILHFAVYDDGDDWGQVNMGGGYSIKHHNSGTSLTGTTEISFEMSALANANNYAEARDHDNSIDKTEPRHLEMVIYIFAGLKGDQINE